MTEHYIKLVLSFCKIMKKKNCSSPPMTQQSYLCVLRSSQLCTYQTLIYHLAAEEPSLTDRTN